MANHRKRSREDWQKIIREYEESGLTIKDFSKEAGVSAWSIKDWRKKFRIESDTFVELACPSIGAEYSIVLSNGRELRVSGSFSEKRVKQLIGVLEEC